MHSTGSIPLALGTSPTVRLVAFASGADHLTARKLPSPASGPAGERPPSINFNVPFIVVPSTVTPLWKSLGVLSVKSYVVPALSDVSVRSVKKNRLPLR